MRAGDEQLLRATRRGRGVAFPRPIAWRRTRSRQLIPRKRRGNTMLGSFRSNVTVPLRRPNIMDRRELLGVLGAARIVAVIDLTAHAQHDGHGGKVYDDCLKACEACERSCNETFHYCYTQVAEGKKHGQRA